MSRTRSFTSPMSSETSRDVPPSLRIKFAWISDTRAPPTAQPLSPQRSMSRPAESPAGLTNTQPMLLPFGRSRRNRRNRSASARIERASEACKRRYTPVTAIPPRKTLSFSDKLTREWDKPVIYGLTVTKSSIGEAAEVEEKKKLEGALRLLKSFDEMGMLTSITAINMKTADDVDFRYTSDLKIEFGSFENYDYKMEWLSKIAEVMGENPKGVVNMHNVQNIAYRQSVD